jgi:hypothetical protein
MEKALYRVGTRGRGILRYGESFFYKLIFYIHLVFDKINI